MVSYIASLTALLLVLLPAVPAIAQTKNCDLPLGNLRNYSADTARTCRMDCERESACKGWVFVSGWGRCFLKKSVNRRVALRLYSGVIARKGEKPRLAEQGADSDHSGRDLQKVSARSADECRDLCLGRDRCFGFTYLDGYRDCWLKKKGRLREKIFYCGEKSQSAN